MELYIYIITLNKIPGMCGYSFRSSSVVVVVVAAAATAVEVVAVFV